MPLTTGIDHVALVTKDLDALLAFYEQVFEATVRFDVKEGNVRHAGIDVGGGAYLHPFEQPNSEHASGLPQAFDRGHLDHVSLTVADDIVFEDVRRRLVARGASDGTVTHWGICREISFEDPDGCSGEVSVWVGDAPRTWEERGIEVLTSQV